MTSKVNVTRDDFENDETKIDLYSDGSSGDIAVNVNVNNNPTDYHAGGDSFRPRNRKPVALVKKTKQIKHVSIEKSKLVSIEVGGDSSTSVTNETLLTERGTTTGEKAKQSKDGHSVQKSEQDASVSSEKVNTTIIAALETLSTKREKTTRMPTKKDGWKTAAEERFGSLQRQPSVDGLNAGLDLSVHSLNINVNQTEDCHDDCAEVPGSTRKENTKRRVTTLSKPRSTKGTLQQRRDSNSNKASINKGHNNSTFSNISVSEETSAPPPQHKASTTAELKGRKSVTANPSKVRGSTTRADLGKNKAREKDVKMLMEYLPTYRMAPDQAEKFSHCAVKKIIQAIADPVLQKFKYSGSEVGPLISKLSNTILKKVKLNLPYRRYRLLCNVYVVHLCGQTVTIADRCLWAKETDNCAVYNHRSRKFACVITLHGIYKD